MQRTGTLTPVERTTVSPVSFSVRYEERGLDAIEERRTGRLELIFCFPI